MPTPGQHALCKWQGETFKATFVNDHAAGGYVMRSLAPGVRFARGQKLLISQAEVKEWLDEASPPESAPALPSDAPAAEIKPAGAEPSPEPPAIAPARKPHMTMKMTSLAERLAATHARQDRKADELMARLDSMDQLETVAFKRSHAFLDEKEQGLNEVEATLRQMSNLPLSDSSDASPAEPAKV